MMTEELHTDAAERSIGDHFASIAARHRDRIAVRSSDSQWTYAELDRNSDAIARAILGAGATDEPVAVLIGKNTPLVVAAFLGVLKAGAIHVSLDPHAPAERTRAMLADCAAKILLADHAHCDIARELAGGQSIVLNVEGLTNGSAARFTQSFVDPGAPAVITYTSGSTGQPKGVVVSHRSVLHNVRNMARSIALNPGERVALLFTFGVMGGPRDALAALLSGASVSLYDMGASGIPGLAAWIRTQSVGYLNLVVSVLRQFLATLGPEERFPSVRVVKSGSEPLSPADLAAIARHFSPECRTWVGYGLTETGNVTHALVDRAAPAINGILLVGPASAGVEILVLDEQEKPVPPGQPGLLAVRSRYLADGYWKRPEQTALVFRPDPDGKDQRIYLTGDRGRIHADGMLELLGRGDRLVKIRGLKVDLDAIETAMRAHPAVRQAAVVAASDHLGNTRLAGYVAWKSGASVAVQALAAALAAQLPAHFVPAAFVVLDELPLTRQGKLDRRALPPVDYNSPGAARSPLAPRSAAERVIAEVWGRVLGLEEVGVTERFVDLGGDSLSAGRIGAKVAQMIGAEIPIGVLLRAETVEAMALVAMRALIDRGDFETAARWLRPV